jgi:ATP-dependent protease ClpP protease subunit
MKNVVNFVKKPVVWIVTGVACAIGVAVGVLVKFKDKIFG